MDRIKLNLEPGEAITFEREVAIPTPDGNPFKLKFLFRHRTREQVAEMFDRVAAAKPADGEAVPAKPMVEMVRDAIKRDVALVLEIAADWGAEPKFDADNLARFFGLYAGAAAAIAVDYRISLVEGRLGN